MKLVITLTLIIAVVVSAGIGCLVIFEILSLGQGLEYILKSLAVIALLGAASAAISLVTGKHNAPRE